MALARLTHAVSLVDTPHQIMTVFWPGSHVDVLAADAVLPENASSAASARIIAAFWPPPGRQTASEPLWEAQ